jgi:hypothetical protein
MNPSLHLTLRLSFVKTQRVEVVRLVEKSFHGCSFHYPVGGGNKDGLPKLIVPGPEVKSPEIRG